MIICENPSLLFFATYDSRKHDSLIHEFDMVNGIDNLLIIWSYVNHFCPAQTSLGLIASDSRPFQRGKYGALSRSEGHSKWFLQKTLLEHDKSMDHPWMQMIYKQVFSLKQYATWLALNHAIFGAMEETLGLLLS